MAKILQVRLDDKTKTDVDILFSSLGLDTSTAVRIFFKAALERGGIPFPVVKPTLVEKTLDEKIIEAALKRNPKRVTLKTNEKGHIIIDKELQELHPNIYDWAVNG